MPNVKVIATPASQDKVQGKEPVAPTIKGILKSSQDSPSSPNISRHPWFSPEANTIITIPAENRGLHPTRSMQSKKNRLFYNSRAAKGWVIVNTPRIERGAYITYDDACDDPVMVSHPDQENTNSKEDEEIISVEELMALSNDERADLILSEPSEHTRIRLQRHLHHDSESSSK